MRDSDDHVQGHGHQRQTQYVYGRSFGARMFGAVMNRLKGLETSVNMSTFGRVFRLDGSGHVRQNLRSYECPPSCPRVLMDCSLASHVARPDTGRQLLHRDPCRADDVCDNGVHYRCKCAYVGARVRENFDVLKSYRLLTPVSQADILSETGGTCVCDKPLTSGGKCQNESQWSSCSAGKKTNLLVSCVQEERGTTLIKKLCRGQTGPHHGDRSAGRSRQHPLWLFYQSSRRVGVSLHYRLF